MLLTVPISPGEFLDKQTILELKCERIADPDKVANVRRELDLLRATWQASPLAGRDVAARIAELKEVNAILWEVEDAIRLKEAGGAFDAGFIELARAVYRTNDRRAAIKRRINLELGSEILEEKSYAGPGTAEAAEAAEAADAGGAAPDSPHK